MSQSIEMAVRMDITVLQSIEITSGEIICVTVNRDSLRRDITVSQS